MAKPKVESQKSELVNRYSIPAAILLVGSGVVLAPPPPWIRNWTLGLLFAGIAVNLAFATATRGKDLTWGSLSARMGFNIAINAGLVYLLAAYWRPVWLLLALSPIATAVYSTRAKTHVAILIFGFLLLGLRMLQGGGNASPADWGEVVVRVLFVGILSLMINDLAAKRG